MPTACCSYIISRRRITTVLPQQAVFLNTTPSYTDLGYNTAALITRCCRRRALPPPAKPPSVWSESQMALKSSGVQCLALHPLKLGVSAFLDPRMQHSTPLRQFQSGAASAKPHRTPFVATNGFNLLQECSSMNYCWKTLLKGLLHNKTSGVTWFLDFLRLLTVIVSCKANFNLFQTVTDSWMCDFALFPSSKPKSCF